MGIPCGGAGWPRAARVASPDYDWAGLGPQGDIGCSHAEFPTCAPALGSSLAPGSLAPTQPAGSTTACPAIPGLSLQQTYAAAAAAAGGVPTVGAPVLIGRRLTPMKKATSPGKMGFPVLSTTPMHDRVARATRAFQSPKF